MRQTWSFRDTPWIYTANFTLNKQDVLALESMLATLRDLKGVTIVFDSRGNKGGDSSVGTSIFDAATGGLAFDLEGVEKLPSTPAARTFGTED